mmetsp:Transcript_6417/g.8927  ORF Transcript_6417/g.8927 Transcript_6417/m.8927 type:complete len:203 (-) Transcript_6417:50-658(-)
MCGSPLKKVWTEWKQLDTSARLLSSCLKHLWMSMILVIKHLFPLIKLSQFKKTLKMKKEPEVEAVVVEADSVEEEAEVVSAAVVEEVVVVSVVVVVSAAAVEEAEVEDPTSTLKVASNNHNNNNIKKKAMKKVASQEVVSVVVVDSEEEVVVVSAAVVEMEEEEAEVPQEVVSPQDSKPSNNKTLQFLICHSTLSTIRKNLN